MGEEALMNEWLPVAALVAFFLSRALSADVPPAGVRIPKPQRMALAGLLGGIGCAVFARSQGYSWPAAVAQGLAATGAAWGLDMAVPEGAHPPAAMPPAAKEPPAKP